MEQKEELIRQIVSECIDKWGEDLNTRDLLFKTNKWLEPTKIEEKDTFLKLLVSFNYYSRDFILEIFRELCERYKQLEKEHEYSLFLPMISPTGRFNHSYDMISCYQTANKLGKEYFGTELNEVLDNYPLHLIKNIVLIDDVIGTGATICNSISHYQKYYPQLIKDKKIYIMTLEALENGIQFLEKYFKENSMEVKLIIKNKHKKAFEIGHVFPDENMAKNAKEMITSYEIKITNNNSDFILGFNGSEALMAFFYDTPNNTLSIFWRDNDHHNWKALFPRMKLKKPSWNKDIKSKSNAQGRAKYELQRAIHGQK